MKKVLFVALGLAVVIATAPMATAEASGVEGFLTGCCFGLRVGADYNDQGTGDRDFTSWFLVGFCLGPRAQMDYKDGKDFHWREVCRVLPYVGAIFAIWDGVDISSGKGRADLQEAYGANYY